MGTLSFSPCTAASCVGKNMVALCSIVPRMTHSPPQTRRPIGVEIVEGNAGRESRENERSHEKQSGNE